MSAHEGRSINEILWEAMDLKMQQINDPEFLDLPAEDPEVCTTKGKAAGLAYAMAVLRNPYKIQDEIKWVREEAMRRWENANGAEELVDQ